MAGTTPDLPTMCCSDGHAMKLTLEPIVDVTRDKLPIEELRTGSGSPGKCLLRRVPA